MSVPGWIRALLGNSTPQWPPPDAHSPDWYRAYASAFGPGPDPATPVGAVKVAVLDAETTGLDVSRDRMLSLGILRVTGNSISLSDKLEGYLPTPPGFEGSAAVPIHGIIPNSSRYRLSEEPQLLERLLDYLGSDPIVGHHIGFDIAVINAALERYGAGPLRNLVIDTGVLAKRLRPAGYWTPDRDYSLDALARRYSIPLSDRHTALGDCYITAVLYLKLLRRLEVKRGKTLLLRDVVVKL